MPYTLRFVCCLTWLLFSVQLFAQQPSTLDVPDTTEEETGDFYKQNDILQDSTQLVVKDTTEKVRFKLIKSILDNKYPNPNRAAAMSLLLPGSGQIYNKKVWKLPLVYGALGGLGFWAVESTKDYRTFRDAYLAVVDDEVDTVSPFSTLSESGHLTLRDRFNKQRQQAYIFFALAWILNSVDAFVDAHLNSFDVSEDISLQVNPTGLRVGDANGVGIGLHFTYQNSRNQGPTFLY